MSIKDYIPDYNELHDRYDAERQREMDKLPKCDYCGKTIMDDYLYDFDGDLICEDCLNDNFRKRVEDYVE